MAHQNNPASRADTLATEPSSAPTIKDLKQNVKLGRRFMSASFDLKASGGLQGLLQSGHTGDHVSQEDIEMQIRSVGMPWFEEADYADFRRLLPERRWHATFDAWRQAAEQNLEKIRSTGVLAIKAHVQSQAFVIWCASRGLDVNSQALTRYAAEFASRQALQASGKPQ